MLHQVSAIADKKRLVKKKALILEDDENIRALFAHIVRRRGYEVVGYPDPTVCPLSRTSRCACPADSPCADVVITDLHMPNVTGLEFIAAQKEKGCRVGNIALITADPSGSDVDAATELGCRAFTKPVSVAQINEWLDECEQRS